MPRGQKPEGEHPLSNAERQARYRARHLKQPPPVVIRTRRPVDRRSRPQRWDDATNVLLGIQVECVDWLMALPDSLRGTADGRGAGGDRRSRPLRAGRDQATARLRAGLRCNERMNSRQRVSPNGAPPLDPATTIMT